MKERSVPNASEVKIRSQLHEFGAKLDEFVAHCKGEVAHSVAAATAEMKQHHQELENRFAELRSTGAANAETMRTAVGAPLAKLTTQLNSLYSKR